MQRAHGEVSLIKFKGDLDAGRDTCAQHNVISLTRSPQLVIANFQDSAYARFAVPSS